MAVSLALNWKLPATSSLFDDNSTDGLPLRESNTNVNSPNQASAIGSQDATSSRGSKQTPPPSSSANTSLKSYAAAVSSKSSLPQLPMPSYGGVGLSGQHNYGGLDGTQPYSNASTWAGTFQPSAPPSKALVSEDGRRLRTTSGPQRPSHLTYNDTLQQYPTALGVQHGRVSNRPPVIPQSSSSPTLSSTGNAGASGYHPYRRTVKGSDPSGHGLGSPNLQGYSSTPTAATTHQVNLPQSPPRIRSASTTSSGAGREITSASVASPPPTSYSHVASVAATQSSPQLSSSQMYALGRPPVHGQQSASSPSGHQQFPARPYEPSRQSSTTSSETGPGRWDGTGSTDSFATADGRSRTNSVSSTSSGKERASPTATAPASVNGGRSTPLGRKPLPSPLSRTKPFSDEDETGERSDDEATIGGRTTPTPSDKPKKGMSKLRKALSLSTLQQVEAAAAAPDRAYGGRANVSTRKADGTPYPHSSLETNGSSGSTRSTSPPRTPDNGAPLPGSSGASISSRRSMRPPIAGADSAPKRSIFNRKFNSSTDNISISSTVSSASMMLRKVGNLGKLARRSNIMGITNMFNKDKEDGRSGLHNDDFGTLQTSSELDSKAAAKAAAKKEKISAKAAKKGNPAIASVSHATVELETSPGALAVNGDSSSMTPAASYVRQHQLQMRAEAERLAREQAEAERQAALAAAAARKTKTTDDLAEGRQKMIEKEKERLKSKRGWRKRLVGSLGSSAEVQQVTGLETIPINDSSMAANGQAPQVVGGYNVPGAVEVSGPQPQLGRSAHHQDASFDSAFDEGDLEPPQMPSVAEGYESSGDDFETDSLRHWGEGIERSRESAAKIKAVKSILKSTGPPNEPRDEDIGSSDGALSSPERPFASRLRANSYDAPQNSSPSTSSVPLMSQISTSASTDRVDGVARPDDDRSATPDERLRSGSATPTQGLIGGGGSSLGHHPNASLPTLSHMTQSSPTGQRIAASPGSRKRLAFAEAHIYHSTWPAHVYDRRGELATCNRLTPLLAQRIKEELNTYKMEEMAVAPSSRIHTHFFV